jgi:hypothetical protein
MKKAFLVGINKYTGSPLRGCVNDVVVIHQILTTKFGFKNENVKIITDYEATKKNIINGLKWLTQGVKSGDSIVFHYSGHGSQVMVDDWTATEEVDGRDAILISGCEENQTSADAWLSNRYQGAMTYTLAHVLQKYNYNITYSELIIEINKIMDKYRFTQNPQLECKEEFFNNKFLK